MEPEKKIAKPVEVQESSALQEELLNSLAIPESELPRLLPAIGEELRCKVLELSKATPTQQVTTPMAEVLEAIMTGPILTDAQVDEKMQQLRAKNSAPAPE